MTKILVIDDEMMLREAIVLGLRAENFEVFEAEDGITGMQLARTIMPDLIVSDINMKGMDGYDTLAALRTDKSTANIPFVLMTGRADLKGMRHGMSLGADDYLPKPFEPRELLARLRAILRRRVDLRQIDARRGVAPAAHDFLRFGRLEIDPAAHAARLDGVPCELTAYQFDLLLVMAQHAGRVLSRDALMDLLKGEPLEAFDRSIDVHMSRIRAAVEDDPKHPRRIITVRGAGYLFAKVQD